MLVFIVFDCENVCVYESSVCVWSVLCPSMLFPAVCLVD